jgi:uncharacterized phiE125 gp8 family phage protein
VVEAPKDEPLLVFVTPPPQPGRTRAGIEIDMIAGYGNAADDVPQPLREAILLLVAQWFDDRASMNEHMPLGGAVGSLIAPFRRMRL